jgi:hypothetical protein
VAGLTTNEFIHEIVLELIPGVYVCTVDYTKLGF